MVRLIWKYTDLAVKNDIRVIILFDFYSICLLDLDTLGAANLIQQI
jgi:hypothetical protein